MEISFLTSNPHKFAEALEACGGSRVVLKHIPLKYEEPRGESCGDVIGKCLSGLAEKMPAPFIIEDSGLYINALGGFPGPYSAFVHKRLGLAGILRLMRGVEDRSAHFESAIGYWDGNEAKVFMGIVEGEISHAEKGGSGFGYDPLFIPKGYKFTFAENMSVKHELSHRAKAFREFISYVDR